MAWSRPYTVAEEIAELERDLAHARARRLELFRMRSGMDEFDAEARIRRNRKEIEAMEADLERWRAVA
jgi:hypothetical protein